MRNVVRPWRDPVFLGFLLLGLALLGASAACWQRAAGDASPVSPQAAAISDGPSLAVLAQPGPAAPIAVSHQTFELPF